MANEDGLREAVNRLRWLHQIDFGDGIISPGMAPIAMLQEVAAIYFEAGVKGRPSSISDAGTVSTQLKLSNVVPGG